MFKKDIIAEKIFFLQNIYGFTPAQKKSWTFQQKMSKSKKFQFP